jgi:hypothetical protein
MSARDEPPVTVGERLASGVDSTADQEYRLCEALGLDPAEVFEVYIEIQPGRGAVMRWSSVRKVDLGRIVQAVESVPVSVSEKWTLPADPWDTPPVEPGSPEDPFTDDGDPAGVCGHEAHVADTEPCQLVNGHSGWHANTRGVTWPSPGS